MNCMTVVLKMSLILFLKFIFIFNTYKMEPYSLEESYEILKKLIFEEEDPPVK